MARHVWIAIPAYTGTIHLGTMRSVLTDFLALQARGDTVEIYDEVGNAMIADCRATIVAKFLESAATDLVFVDADVTFEKGALVRLVDHPVEFVAGIYPYRRDPIDYPISWIQERDELIATNGLLEVEGVPAGFMRCSRAMLEKMVDHYPDTVFLNAHTESKTAHALFDTYRIGKMKFGEDYAFCRRWKDIGGKVWIDPEINMGHVGFKTFTGNIGEWLRNRP